jgi:hypothetical protein
MEHQLNKTKPLPNVRQLKSHVSSGSDFKKIDSLIICCFTPRSRIFYLYGDVTIAGEGLQNLYSHVDSIYPNEMEIKDTTECSTSALYLDVLLKLDTNGKITTQLYDKRDYFNFSIINFHYLCGNMV